MEVRSFSDINDTHLYLNEVTDGRVTTSLRISYHYIDRESLLKSTGNQAFDSKTYTIVIEDLNEERADLSKRGHTFGLPWDIAPWGNKKIGLDSTMKELLKIIRKFFKQTLPPKLRKALRKFLAEVVENQKTERSNLMISELVEMISVDEALRKIQELMVKETLEG
jgi:hypothetical protein